MNIYERKHYVVGSEGNAGSIVKRFLDLVGVDMICIDEKLNNYLPDEVEPGSFLYIETPPKSHYTFIQYGFENWMNIFVEKPLLYSLKDNPLFPTYFPPNTHLFCNFNMEVLDLPTQEMTKAVRYCAADKPLFIAQGERGVILDLMPHLLSIFPLENLSSLHPLKVQTKGKDGTDVFAQILFNDGLVMEVGYNIKNLILLEYKDGSSVKLDWLPGWTWDVNIRKFWQGETNLHKALEISRKIETMYELRESFAC